MRSRALASAFYFTYYAAMGTLIPYLTIYYRQVGMSTAEIGVLAALPTITVLFAAPLWGAIADTFGLHGRLLVLAAFGTMAPVAALTQASAFPVLALCAVAYAILNSPIIPLADTTTLEILGDARSDYGRLRIWGAVGYGLFALGAGLLADRLGMAAAFAVFVTMMGITGLIARRLPAPPRLHRASYLTALRMLSGNRRWLAFLGAVFMAGMCYAMLSNYFPIYLVSIGATTGLIGLSVAAAGISELPIFAFSSRLLRRLKPQGLLMVALAFYAIRALACSLITDPRWAVAVQLLHGLTFSAMWVAAVVYAGQIAPRGLGASAQAAVGAVNFGLAAAVGALVGAAIYEAAGPVWLFRVAALLALVGLALVAGSETRARQTARLGL